MSKRGVFPDISRSFNIAEPHIVNILWTTTDKPLNTGHVSILLFHKNSFLAPSGSCPSDGADLE
jgi:hypothetical protein